MEAPAKESAFVVIAKRNPDSKEKARSSGSKVFDLRAASGRELTNLSEKPLVRVAKKLEVALDASSEYHRRFMAGESSVIFEASRLTRFFSQESTSE